MLGGWGSPKAEMVPAMESRQMTPLEKVEEGGKCGLADESANFKEMCPYFNDLQYQLAQSYYWSGNFMKDYFFFVANWHPFFGMLCSHPYHPWEKKERILTFIVSCSITMLPSALLVKDFSGKGESLAFAGQLVIFISITLPVMLVEVALYWLSIGDIFCANNPCAHVVRGVKSGCLCFSLFISAIAVGLSFLTLGNEDPLDLVRPFVISRCQSYLTWFPIWFLLPCMGFAHCWTMESNALPEYMPQ